MPVSSDVIIFDTVFCSRCLLPFAPVMKRYHADFFIHPMMGMLDGVRARRSARSGAPNLAGGSL